MRPTGKRKLLIVALGVGAFGLLCAGAVLLTFVTIAMPTNDRDNQNPAKQQEMLKITLHVASLAPIPSGASIKSIKTEGNMFTRTFCVEFSADAGTIKKWLGDSRGIKAAKIEKTTSGVKYVIEPGDGYNWAEVVVDHSARTVHIRVEWS